MFNKEVVEKINYYVYRLFDPTISDGDQTFYIGKGQGNRVFAHAENKSSLKSEIFDDEQNDLKLDRIRKIIKAGHKVGYIIHRHGMCEATALHVEAALIEAYPNLTNKVGGHGCNDFGASTVDELVQKYGLPPLELDEQGKAQHKLLLINVNRTNDENERSIYDQVRFCWKIDARRANSVDFILPIVRGMTHTVFRATQDWLPADDPAFSALNDIEPSVLSTRKAFIGEEAPADIQALYAYKRIPDSLRHKQNPIRYLD